MRYLLLLLFFCLPGFSLSAQKFLQMERVGSFKVKRYYPGEQVTFKIQGDDSWYTEDILDVLIEDEIVLFTYRAIRIENITHLRSFQRKRWSKPIGQQLYNFGAGWLLFSLGAAIIREPPLSQSSFTVPLTAGALGFLIQKIFRQQTYKMGKNRRLRLLDLSFQP